MDNRVVPYDQGIYYPATSVDGTYGYVYTGPEEPNEYDQYPNPIGLDGWSFQLPGRQNENFPCVYYTPGYDYVQSSYNPYSPYIPGAVIGTDTQFMGTQHMQTVPQLSYIPVMYQPPSDAMTTRHPDALYFNNGVGYSPALLPMNESAMPLKVSSDNLSWGLTQPANEMHVVGRYPDVVAGVGPHETSSTKLLQYGYMTGGASQMMQMPNHSLQGGVLSITNPVEATLPANNGILNEEARPRFEYNHLLNKNPSEQNMGPRTNRPKDRLKSPIFLKAFTTNARNSNSVGNIVLNPNEYNKPDFYVDYPNAKFFVIKSYSEDDVHKSIKYNVWSSTINGNEKLDKAYEEAQRLSAGTQRKCPVFLFFSVNASGHFCGVAEMIGPVDFHKDMDFWLQDKWSGCFPVKWHIIKDVTNSSFRHIILVNNERRPVTSSRDTQEVPYLPGMNMLAIFKSSPLKTCILDDFSYYEERQRMIHEEKSMIRLIYETSTNDLANGKEEISVPNATDLANGKEEIYVKSTDELNSQMTSNEPLESIVQMSNDANNNVKLSKETRLSDQNDVHVRSNNSTKNIALSKEMKQSYQSNVHDNSSNFTVEEKLGQKKLHVKSRYAKKDVKEYKEAERTTQSNVLVDSDNATKDSEDSTDVLTVGSMQINITDANRLISGILTIGLRPDDKKG